MTSAAPGSAQGLYLTVADVAAARGELAGRGADVSEVFHAGTLGSQFQPDGTSSRVSGSDPDGASYSSFATVSGQDGNGWLQEVTIWRPGRVDAAQMGLASAAELAGTMRRTSAARDEHENRIGEADRDWRDRYAAYMVAEQAGTELPR